MSDGQRAAFTAASTTERFAALVRAQLSCTVVVRPVDDDLRRVFRWALHLWQAGHADTAPLWWVHDLGLLLLHGSLVSLRADLPAEHIDAETGSALASTSADIDVIDTGELDELARATRLLMLEEVVTPSLANPAVQRLLVHLQGIEADAADRAIAHALSLAAPSKAPTAFDSDGRPVATDVGVSVGARVAALRLLLDRGELGHLISSSSSSLVAMQARMAAVAEQQAFLHDSTPLRFSETALWEIMHLEEVPSEAQRLALRAVLSTTEAIAPPSSSILDALRDPRADVVLDDTDDDRYPAGGFDAMSTQGAIENLVRSEVAYVGVGAEHDPRAADLFDVRFIEGELLYYTRDESPLLERRRIVDVVIEDIGRLRHKRRALPDQTSVLVEATVLRALRDLQATFSPQAVSLRLLLARADNDADRVDDGGGDGDSEERGLLRTVLSADIAHQRATVEHLSLAASSLKALSPLGRKQVIFSTRPAPTKQPRLVWVRVGGDTWEVRDGEADVVVVDANDLRPVVDVLLLAS